jgi:hypothetical protein
MGDTVVACSRSFRRKSEIAKNNSYN